MQSVRDNKLLAEKKFETGPVNTAFYLNSITSLFKGIEKTITLSSNYVMLELNRNSNFLLVDYQKF